MKRFLFLFVSALLILTMIPLAVGCQSTPKVVFEASVTSGQAPLTVVFTNKTQAASDNITNFSWDFGDGHTVNTGSVAESVTHEYTKVGTFTVTVIFSRKDKPSKTSLATQTITVAHGPVSAVKVMPATIELNIGQLQTFTSDVADSSGNPISEAALSWQASAGTITDQGVFTAGTKAGTFDKGVTAAAEQGTASAEGSASVIVKPDPLAAAALPVLEIAAGDTKQLQAVADDQYGNPIKDLAATWSLSNSDAGSITSAGLYTAPKKAGSYSDVISVEVKQGDTVRQAKGNITIVPGALNQIITAPTQIDLGMGMTQQFIAVGIDKNGNRINGLDFSWSVSGSAGSITGGGLFTAGDKPGIYNENITVTAAKNGVTQTVTPDVTIEPDRVIFFSNRADPTKTLYDVYIMDIDGSNVKKLSLGGGTTDARVESSPDGRSIMYVDLIYQGSTLTDETLYMANTDGSWQKSVVSGTRVFEPRWSSDGQKIVFQSWEHDPPEIYSMDVDGGNFQRLTNNAVYDDYPDWSPDGTKVVFISEMDKAVVYPKIYVMNADGSQQHEITKDYSYDLFPQWSADGKQILFQSNRFPASTWGIFLMNADGSDIRVVSASADYSSYSPSWSPDGSKVIFNSTKDTENDEIYTINPDGTNLTRLTVNTAIDYAPTWLPRKQGVKVSDASLVIPEKFDTPNLTASAITSLYSDAVVRVVSEIPEGTVSGSGIIIQSDGLILTCNHLVSDATKTTVYLKDGTSYAATIAARDKFHDLALLRIKATGLTTLTIGDLSGVNTGESVMVLGYPLGNENVSVSSGLLSSMEYDEGWNTIWLQTDSAINPGNSGGPLLDMQGKVIGMVTRKVFGIGVEGIGYAISANTIKLYLPDLLAQANK